MKIKLTNPLTNFFLPQFFVNDFIILELRKTIELDTKLFPTWKTQNLFDF
jgi:hypothetical protein